jgi:hypothetical protein
VPCFCDPRNVINCCKGCKLRMDGMLGLGCAETWCHVMDNDRLDGGHSSIIDARAQQETVTEDNPFMQCLRCTSHAAVDVASHAKMVRCMELTTKGKDSQRQSKPKSARRSKQGWQKQAGVAHPAFGRSEETKGPRLALLTSGRNATVPR